MPVKKGSRCGFHQRQYNHLFVSDLKEASYYFRLNRTSSGPSRVLTTCSEKSSSSFLMSDSLHCQSY